MGIWLEIVTLLIPGFNDSDEELQRTDGISCQCFARYSLARDRLSQGLQNVRPTQHDAPKICCARPKSASKPDCVISMLEICPVKSQTLKTRNANTAVNCSSSVTDTLSKTTASLPKALVPDANLLYRAAGQRSSADKSQTGHSLHMVA